ncbi:MAG: hypothetical protein K0Q92_3468 [Steroidobacteraceae bacterium]|nr:hypothetical protein [Steroidobacteraceae bacterium]
MKPAPLERGDGLRDGRMLDDRRHDAATIADNRSLNREIVGLCAPRREDDFIRIAVDQRGHFAASSLDSVARDPAILMAARWIAEMLFQEWQHCIDDFRKHRRRGVVIEVDGAAQKTITLPAPSVQRASSSMELRCDPSMRSASDIPRASMQEAQTPISPPCLLTAFNITSML